jgi:hypothetical protein
MLEVTADPDRHRFQFRVMDVRRDDHAAAGDFVAHQFRRDFLAEGDVLHLFGDLAAARVSHLREVAVLVFGFALGQPLCPRFQNFVPAIGVSAVPIAYRHFRLYHPSGNLIPKLYAASPGKADGESRTGKNESLRLGRQSK